FRGVMLIFLTIIAPIAFLLWTIPTTERYFRQWLSLYAGTLFVKLVHMLTLMIGGILLTMVGATAKQGFFDTATVEKLVLSTVALIGVYAVMLKAPSMLLQAAAGTGISVLGSMRGAVTGFLGGIVGGTLGGALGGLGGSGRALGGGAGTPLGGGGASPIMPSAGLPLGGMGTHTLPSGDGFSLGSEDSFGAGFLPFGGGTASALRGGGGLIERIASASHTIGDFDRGMRRLAFRGGAAVLRALMSDVTSKTGGWAEEAGGSWFAEGSRLRWGVDKMRSMKEMVANSLGYVTYVGRGGEETYREYAQMKKDAREKAFQFFMSKQNMPDDLLDFGQLTLFDGPDGVVGS
ncbi:MAG: hypothetical protein QXH08_00165, partial [Candidatus Hadarchaeales archaeon]